MKIPIEKQLILIGSKEIYLFTKPLEDFDGELLFEDNIEGLDGSQTIDKEFSFSIDSDEWSPWKLLTNTELSQVPKSRAIYLKFKWTLSSNLTGAIITIKDFNLTYTSKTGFESDEPVVPQTLKDFKVPDFYKLGEDYAKIESDTNYFVNSNYGVETTYWRTEPDTKSKDVFLNEWSLKDTVDKKCLRILVPENLIPTDELQFTEWGTEFQEFQAEVSKVYFESIFGRNMKPRNSDYLFIPKVNRMYTVYSSFLKRGIDGKATGYILQLKTYEHDTSVSKSEETEAFFEDNTLSFENLFQDQIEDQIKDTVNTKQNRLATISDDVNREDIDKGNIIVLESVFNNNTELLKNYYNFNNCPKSVKAITYSDKVSIDTNGGISIAEWINLQEEEQSFSVSVLTKEKIDYRTMKITTDIDMLSKYVDKDRFLEIGSTAYKVIEVIDKNTAIVASTDLPSLLMGTFRKSIPLSIFNTSDISNYILGNRLIILKEDQKIIHKLQVFERDKWYCVVINYSNKFGYTGVYSWSLNENGENSTALVNESQSEIPLSSLIQIKDDSVSILSSKSFVGNIRVFKNSIDLEQQSFVMASKPVPKPSMAFIIDDAKTIFNSRSLNSGIINSKI